MPNLDTIDTLIAIVIVLLVLSLIVQSIQTALKKLFKLKSRQLEESLIDLFENVLEQKPTTGERSRMPTLQMFKRHPSTQTSPVVKKVFDDVKREFEEIGRVSARGKWMLDSISKADLMKILRKVGPDSLMPNTLENLQTACALLGTLQTQLASVRTDLLSGEANAKFAKLQEALSPVVNDIECIFTGGKLNAGLLLDDILNMREIKLGDVLDLLGEVQKTVGANLAAAQAGAPGTPDTLALAQLDGNLKAIAASLSGLRGEFDKALAPLRVKLTEIENWYDTVMQSFEERYNRGMKTYAIAIGFAVTVWLNANLFNIYRDVSTSATRRDAILGSREDVLKRYEEQLAAAKLSEVTPAPTPQPQATTPTQTTPTQAAAQPQTTPHTQTPAPPLTAAPSGPPASDAGAERERQNQLQKLVDDTRAEIEADATRYASFGFMTLDEEFKNHPKQPSKWRHVLLWSLPGWLLTAALLSLGAPFWHDALESLFGVKNLLRKRGDIKNVEKEAGAGQPQS